MYYQKIKIKIAILGIIFLFTQCGKNECKNGFEMTYQEVIELPAGANTFETHNFLINDISSDYDLFLNGNGVTDSDIQQINTQYLELVAITGNVEYNIIERIVVEISADSLPEVEIAFLEPVPLKTGNVLQLFPSLPDVHEYLLKDNFTLRIRIRFRDIPQQFIETRVRIGFLACLDN